METPEITQSPTAHTYTYIHFSQVSAVQLSLWIVYTVFNYLSVSPVELSNVLFG